jgi:hypothetical protein
MHNVAQRNEGAANTRRGMGADPRTSALSSATPRASSFNYLSLRIS